MTRAGRFIAAIGAVCLIVGPACTGRPAADRSNDATSVTTGSGSSEAARTLGHDDLVLVFSGSGRRGGDVFVMYGDGHTELLDAPARRAALYPGFVNRVYHRRGRAFVVERRSLRSNAARLVYVSLPKKEVIPLAAGAFPAADPLGGATSRIAFAERPGGSTLVFADIGTDYRHEVDIGAPIGRIAFDAGGRYAYVLSDEEHPRLTSHDSTGELGPVEIHSKYEDVFLAIASDPSDSVVVLRACCTAGAYRNAALTEWWLAEIKNGATGEPKPPRNLVSLNEIGLSSGGMSLENLRLAPAGTLDAEVRNGRITWSVGAERAWIFGYRTSAWLIDASGEITNLGELGNGGVAVAPRFL